MYWIRTLGMFAVMTAMLMAVGAIVSWFFAGSFFIGMGVMLVISILMSVFSYFKCKDMALKANPEFRLVKGEAWLLSQAVTGYELFTGEKPDLSRMSAQI